MVLVVETAPEVLYKNPVAILVPATVRVAALLPTVTAVAVEVPTINAAAESIVNV